ncbi:MAG: DUF3048 domain-containing protein [Roseiflexaceae bacterium]|nr:DUF3048 domain-containing protein [Roseiflexaceae bacterium]
MSKRFLALLIGAALLIGVAPLPTTKLVSPAAQGISSLARGTIAKRPYAVMIDNHPNAYPQTGLGSATVVFEALAEYGITRYMAIYVTGVTDELPSLGPVRSARLYFVQWAMGFKALYAHAGGSPQALQLLETTNAVVNLDALKRSGGAYFARNSKRSAPHNLFTSTDALTRAASKLNASDLSDSEEIGYLFKADAPGSAGNPATQLGYFFIYKEEAVGWSYDAASNSYLRLRRGKPGLDSGGQQLRTRNVVVMEVKERKVQNDPKGRIEQDVIGSGPARIFLDGIQVEATWKKDIATAPLRFFLADGSEAQFNNGQIWISAVPNLANLTVK